MRNLHQLTPNWGLPEHIIEIARHWQPQYGGEYRLMYSRAEGRLYYRYLPVEEPQIEEWWYDYDRDEWNLEGEIISVKDWIKAQKENHPELTPVPFNLSLLDFI